MMAGSTRFPYVTPDHLHADVALACAKAKKHMLIEKPLATTREDVFRIYQSAKENNVRVMVDLHNRWSQPFVEARARIEAGELGALRHGYLRLNDIKWVGTDMLPWSADSSFCGLSGATAQIRCNGCFRTA